MSSTRKWLVRLVQLVLVGLVLWGVYHRLGPDLRRLDTSELSRWRPSVPLLAASLAALVAVYLAHALLWRRIVIDVLGRAPRRATIIRVYFVASLGRYIPGRIWQLAGLALLSQRAGMPPVAATGAALLGQLGFLSTGVLFLVLLLPAWAGLAPLVVVGVLVAALALVVYILARTRSGARLREWARAHLGERASAALSMADRIRPAHAALWTAGYALTWVVLGGAFVLFCAAFVPDAMRSSGHIAGTVAASYLAGYLAVVVPAGLGVREAVMSLLLSQVLPVSAAVLISVASRVWFTAAELIPLAAVPFMRPEAEPAPGERA